jgi:hypothetical protein
LISYYLSKKTLETGEHEMHTSSCVILPDPNDRIYLGIFYNCQDALREAKRYFDDVDGCSFCTDCCYSDKKIKMAIKEKI